MANDNEYLTSNRKIRYPFIDDTVLTAYDYSASSGSQEEEQVPNELSSYVFGCFVDAMVQVKTPYERIRPRITGIKITANTILFTLVGECEDTSVTVPPVHLRCSRSLNHFPVITSESDWCWYVFVMSSDGIGEYSDYSSQIGDISCNTLDLAQKCIGSSSIGLEALHIYGGEQGNPRYTREEAMLHDPDVIVSGNVKLKAGYNMRFSEKSGNLALNAIPGAGMGVAPCDNKEECITFKTPGLLSADGHSRIFNDTCYDLVADRENDKHGYLYMHAKCKACCTCAMYEDIVNKRLIPLRDKISLARKSLNETLDTYEKNVDRWNERLSEAYPEDIVVTMTGSVLDAAATNVSGNRVSGKMSRCGFSAVMRNDSFVPVKFTLDSILSNGDMFESQVSYMNEESTPVVLPVNLASSEKPIFSVTLAAGRSAVLTYFLRLPTYVGTDKQTGFFSNIRVSAYQDDRLIDTRFERVSI